MSKKEAEQFQAYTSANSARKSMFKKNERKKERNRDQVHERRLCQPLLLLESISCHCTSLASSVVFALVFVGLFTEGFIYPRI